MQSTYQKVDSDDIMLKQFQVTVMKGKMTKQPELL